MNPEPLLGQPHPRALLAALELGARKALGQNFLVSEDVPRQIVSVAQVGPEDVVLEVGPGLGALTLELERVGARVFAIEKDHGLAVWLQQRFAGSPRISIVEADALEWNPAQLPGPPARRRVLANLPYNVAIPILFHLLDSGTEFEDLHLMVQKEVAERMTAAADTDTYGILSLTLGIRATVTPVLDVPPRAFFPAPKVDSTVVCIRPRAQAPFPYGRFEIFEKVVRGAFGERRKTLRNALVSAGFSREQVLDALDRAGIDPQRRGETLDLETFCRLSVCMSAKLNGDGGPEAALRRPEPAPPEQTSPEQASPAQPLHEHAVYPRAEGEHT